MKVSPPSVPSKGPVLEPWQIVERVTSCLPDSLDRVALHEPRFGDRERDYVLDCINTNWVSYAGPYVERFESALAKACGVSDAIAVSSGTVALQLALQLSGVRPGDEVLVPALTFVATANAVVHAGATPHFVDVDSITLGIDAKRLRQHLERTTDRHATGCINRATGRRIAAVIPVHV